MASRQTPVDERRIARLVALAEATPIDRWWKTELIDMTYRERKAFHRLLRVRSPDTYRRLRQRGR